MYYMPASLEPKNRAHSHSHTHERSLEESQLKANQGGSRDNFRRIIKIGADRINGASKPLLRGFLWERDWISPLNESGNFSSTLFIYDALIFSSIFRSSVWWGYFTRSTVSRHWNRGHISLIARIKRYLSLMILEYSNSMDQEPFHTPYLTRDFSATFRSSPGRFRPVCPTLPIWPRSTNRIWSRNSTLFMPNSPPSRKRSKGAIAITTAIITITIHRHHNLTVARPRWKWRAWPTDWPERAGVAVWRTANPLKSLIVWWMGRERLICKLFHPHNPCPMRKSWMRNSQSWW